MACDKCHTSKQYKKTPAACFLCHQEVARFTRGFYKDICRDLISPKAKIVACTGCHDPKAPDHAITKTTCAKCHQEAYQSYFSQWRQQVYDQLAADHEALDALKGCGNNQDLLAFIKETEETLLFLKKDFEHNYRFTAALLKKIRHDLSGIHHDQCQE